MKKQGSFYLKFISIALAVFLVGYVVLSMVISDGVPHTLETALYCEVGDGETVSGFVVRQEEVLVSSEPIVVCELTEGQRVGSGQRVATGYRSDDARQERQNLFSLQNQREQLVLAAQETDGRNADALDTQIGDLIISVASQAADQRIDAMRTYVMELEPLVLRRCVTGDDSEKIQSRINRIDERIALLTTQTASASTAITVDRAGYFSQVADGYETVLTPTSIATMSLADYETIASQTVSPSENAIGRLIEGQTWYFVTEIPLERASQCRTGGSLSVSFAGEGLQELEMTVERMESGETSCLLVLSCGDQMQRVTSLRKQTVEITFDTYEGLRIPKEALYVVDGKTGVYVLEAGRAEWKRVDELLQYGDYYLVAWDSTSTNALWPNDEIIITDVEMWDGKVISE